MQQNDNFYLAEAFQQLRCLNEEAFDLSADRGVVDELQSFVADDKEAPYEEEIIDIEADNDEDLQDNYIGKIILKCSSCGTRLYKDIADVILDENSELANVEEECPVCGNAFGFNVIGKIEPFDEEEFKEEKDEVDDDIGEGGEEVKAEAEFSDDEIGEALKEALNENKDCDEEKCEEKCDKEECDESLNEEVEVNINDKTAAEDAVKLEDSEQEPIKEELGDKAAEDAEKLVDPEENPVKEDLNEDLEEVAVKADNKEINVSTDEGGVHIDISPENSVEESPVEDEMIAPLDDEDKDAIMGNDGEMPEEEAPVEDDEFAIDDFEEESFDELGESFLKRVYENVNSFKTTAVNQNNGKLTVEGLIKFNSGKEKKTSFLFEKFKNTKRGKVMVEGMNETFSKSNKAFLLKGTLSDKKFVSESLTYNYTARGLNESNESETVKVYGRAIVKN